MLHLQDNIYGTGWLDLVFAGRNKQYGAYVLRREYPLRLVKAFFLAASLFVFLVFIPYLLLSKEEQVVADPIVKTLMINDINRVFHLPEKFQPPKTANRAPAVTQAPPVATQKFVVMAPAAVADPEPVPVIADFTEAAPGNVTQPGTTGTGIVGEPGNAGGSMSAGKGNGEDDVLTTADKAPEFPGGQQAFAKFIQKNLRYPAVASDNGITGRVVVNFVVERDGSISEVTILRGIGFGCDQEAIRVLKKVPSWIPGEQNGKKVRVFFTVPLIFEIGN